MQTASTITSLNRPVDDTNLPVAIVSVDDVAAVYRLAFDQICDKKDWKGPFTAWVPWELANLYMQAAEFMTGVAPTSNGRVVLPSGKQVTHLSSIGYSAGPCGR